MVSGLVAVGYSASPLLGMLGMRAFFGTPMTAAMTAGSVLGIAGIALVYWPEFAHLKGDRDTALGALYTAIAVVISALGSLVAHRNHDARLPLWQSMAFGHALRRDLLVRGGAGVRHARSGFEATPGYVLSLLYLALFGSIAAFAAYLTLLRRIGVARSGYVGVMVPIVALVLSAAFEGFRWHALTLAGDRGVRRGQRDRPAAPVGDVYPPRQRIRIAVGLSVLVHLALLAWPLHHPQLGRLAGRGGPDTMIVDLAGVPPPPPPTPPSAPPRPPAPAPAKTILAARARTSRAPFAVPPPVPQATPKPVPTPVPPAPPMDMLAMVNARRERRRAAEAGARMGSGSPYALPDESDDSALAAINRNLESLGRDDGTGGVFQILSKGTYTAMFAFNGWQAGLAPALARGDRGAGEPRGRHRARDRAAHDRADPQPLHGRLQLGVAPPGPRGGAVGAPRGQRGARGFPDPGVLRDAPHQARAALKRSRARAASLRTFHLSGADQPSSAPAGPSAWAAQRQNGKRS